MIVPLIVLAIIFLLIAIRQIGNVKLQIWQIMLGGALVVLLSGQISFVDAFHSINLEVLLFLFGMFIVGYALEESGYLSHLSYKIFKNVRSVDTLVLANLLFMGLASAFLLNDTLAIIGTPVVLLLAMKHKIKSKVLLLALAFSITIGGVMSPIGNPQNLLIALDGGIKNPFVTFAQYLFIPTIINLLAVYVILKLFFKEEFKNKAIIHSEEPIKDPHMAFLSKISLFVILCMIAMKIVTSFVNIGFSIPLGYIAVAGALPILLFSPRRVQVVRHIDWYTLIFFAAMFVLMRSVWDTGFFQQFVNGHVASSWFVMTISIVLSQFISNVPLVALYLPMLMHAGVSYAVLMALAAGSTIAGNLTILGAASNVIIIQNAEKKNETLTFMDFFKIGLPLTIINALVYLLYFWIL